MKLLHAWSFSESRDLLGTVSATGQGSREGGHCEVIEGRSRCLGYINWHGRPRVQVAGGTVRLQGGGWSPAALVLCCGKGREGVFAGLRLSEALVRVPVPDAGQAPALHPVLSEPGRPVGVLWGVFRWRPRLGKEAAHWSVSLIPSTSSRASQRLGESDLAHWTGQQEIILVGFRLPTRNRPDAVPPTCAGRCSGGRGNLGALRWCSGRSVICGHSQRHPEMGGIIPVSETRRLSPKEPGVGLGAVSVLRRRPAS